jgi:hypothetical protein
VGHRQKFGQRPLAPAMRLFIDKKVATIAIFLYFYSLDTSAKVFHNLFFKPSKGAATLLFFA